MNHKAIRASIGFFIVAIIVCVVLYVEWPKRSGNIQHLSSQPTPTATSSVLESPSKSVLGPPQAEATPTINRTPSHVTETVGPLVSAYVVPEVPHIDTISPASGSVGTPVTITGSGFDSTTYSLLFKPAGSSATFNSISFTIVNSSTVTFVVPSTLISSGCMGCTAFNTNVAPGQYTVIVAGSNGYSNQLNFTVTQ